MLNAFYLISIIIGTAGQSIAKKPYTKKTDGKGVYFFNALMSAVALLFFVFTSSKLHFNISVLPYSVGFAVSYALVSIFSVLAIAYGSLSLTSLFISYSLMLPTFYGLVFLDDPISIGLIPGILLLFLSLFLINGKNDDMKISFKWIICAIISFVGNGMCSVIQKMQQVALNGAYKNEFMIVALAIVAAVMIILTVLKERKGIKSYAKVGWLPAIICGALNGMVNLFVLILSGRIPVSLMFPIISAGGLIVTYIVSRFAYKETLTKTQFVGFVLGMAAVIFLNI